MLSLSTGLQVCPLRCWELWVLVSRIQEKYFQLVSYPLCPLLWRVATCMESCVVLTEVRTPWNMLNVYVNEISVRQSIDITSATCFYFYLSATCFYSAGLSTTVMSWTMSKNNFQQLFLVWIKLFSFFLSLTKSVWTVFKFWRIRFVVYIWISKFHFLTQKNSLNTLTMSFTYQKIIL